MATALAAVRKAQHEVMMSWAELCPGFCLELPTARGAKGRTAWADPAGLLLPALAERARTGVRVGLGRFALPLIHFIPDSQRESVPLFLKRQCDRTQGALPGLTEAQRGTGSWGQHCHVDRKWQQ